MRPRNERLTSGYLFTAYTTDDRARNRSLLFLVEGADDIDAIGHIDAICSDSSYGLTRSMVTDQRNLRAVDPRLDPSQITRIEAGELAGLDAEQVRGVLEPALGRLARGEFPLFPAASLAVGRHAVGVMFLDRRAELGQIVSLIDAGKDVLVSAPRRTGKTSLLAALTAVLSERFAVLHLDLEGGTDSESLAAQALRCATATSPREAQRLAEANGWVPTLRRALEELSQTRGQPPLLILDELVYFLEELGGSRDAERHAAMLEFLAGIESARRGLSCPFVLAGSMPLNGFLLDTLQPQTIPVWIEQLVEIPIRPIADLNGVLLRQILIGTGLVGDQQDRRWIADNVDLALPYPALRFLDRLAMTLRETGQPLGPTELETELSSFIRTSDVFNEIAQHIAGPPTRFRRQTVEELVDAIVGAPAEGLRIGLIQDRVGTDGLKWLLDTLPFELRDDRVRSASRLFDRHWHYFTGDAR